MSLRKRGGQWRGSAAVRVLSEVKGNAELTFLIPALTGGGAAYYSGSGEGEENVS